MLADPSPKVQVQGAFGLGRHGPAAFAGSYGLQLGSTFGDHTIDFVKHVLDLRFNAGFSPLPKYRKPPDRDDRASFIGKNHRLLAIEHPSHSLVKRPNLRLVVGIVDAHHRHGVPNRLQFRLQLAAHALRRRIWRDEIGMLLLKVD